MSADEPLAVSGLDNAVVQAGPGLVRRCRRDMAGAEAAESVRREARLLGLLVDVCPVPVPRVVRVEPADGCLVLERLRGSSLLETAPTARQSVAGSVGTILGTVLSRLHAVPYERVHDLVEVDATPLGDWREEAAERYLRLREEIPSALRADVETFTTADPPAAGTTLVFTHNDLGAEHVLVDADLRVTGVIDWTDAAVADPARDFGLVLRDLGPRGLRSALTAYPAADAVRRGVWHRAMFYARCACLEDLEYGLETGLEPYEVNSRVALARLFAGGS